MHYPQSRGQGMNALPKFLAIATVIALGLAFSPEVSAAHKDKHENVTPGHTGEAPNGCLASPVVNTPNKCDT